MRILLTLLALIFLASSALADDTCITSQDDFWLCRGDVAWITGYLIAPEVFDLRLCTVWKEQAELLPTVVDERDEYRKQRDATLVEVYLQRDRAGILEEAYDRCVAEQAACLIQLQQTTQYSTWEVVLIAGGTGALAVLTGLLIGMAL